MPQMGIEKVEKWEIWGRGGKKKLSMPHII
jgi:hypothetical protein